MSTTLKLWGKILISIYGHTIQLLTPVDMIDIVAETIITNVRWGDNRALIEWRTQLSSLSHSALSFTSAHTGFHIWLWKQHASVASYKECFENILNKIWGRKFGRQQSAKYLICAGRTKPLHHVRYRINS